MVRYFQLCSLFIFLSLFLCLTACEIPTGIGASASKSFDEHDVSGEIKAKSFKRLDVGLAGSGHYAVLPTFDKEKGYELSLKLKDHESLPLWAAFTGKEAPEKEVLEAILEDVYIVISPQGDCFGVWQEAHDSYLHLYFFLPQGIPFKSFTLYRKYNAGEANLPDWESLPSAQEILYQKILDSTAVYNSAVDGPYVRKNEDFWEMLGEITDDEKLNETILETWPKSKKAIEWVQNRCENGPDFSDEWKEKALAKAWKYETSECAIELIYAVGAREDIDRMDGILIAAWPHDAKPLQERLEDQNAPMSDTYTQMLIEKCGSVINESKPKAGESLRNQNLKAADLVATIWMAEFYDKKYLYQAAAKGLPPFWPDSHYADEFISKNYKKVNVATQVAFLARGEAAIKDSTSQTNRVKKLLERHAPCSQLSEIVATNPGVVSDSIGRCR